MRDVLQTAKTIWPQVSEDTKVIWTQAKTVIIPVVDEKAAWRDEGKPWELKYEFVGWFDRLTWRGKFWRAIGRIFKSEKLYRRGQFPHYRDAHPLFGQITIELERYDELDFVAGYDAEHDILAVQKNSP